MSWRAVDVDDAWTVADPSACPVCGRDACEDPQHVPPDDAQPSVPPSSPPLAAVPEDARLPLGELLATVERHIRRYVVLAPAQATVIALWVAHTWSIAGAETTPYIAITSAVKRSGKTRLLEVLAALVRNPWLTGRTSAAALIRKIDAQQPTLLLDESDAAFHGDVEYSEALRGVLNTGFRISGAASLCVKHGGSVEFRDFRTFSAKALAGIGSLPSTVADRSLPIVLRRKLQAEPCARWRDREARTALAPVRAQLAAWATPDVCALLAAARPELPPLTSDRLLDVSEPLLAIAELAGDPWPARAREAIVVLAGEAEVDPDLGVELLRDLLPPLLEVEPGALLRSKSACDALIALEDRPWAALGRAEKPLTQRKLANLLAVFQIYPTSDRQRRGYRPALLVEALRRYLPALAAEHAPALGALVDADPASPGSEVSQRQDPNESGEKLRFTKCHSAPSRDTLASVTNDDKHSKKDAVTLQHPENGDVDDGEGEDDLFSD